MRVIDKYKHKEKVENEIPKQVKTNTGSVISAQDTPQKIDGSKLNDEVQVPADHISNDTNLYNKNSNQIDT